MVTSEAARRRQAHMNSSQDYVRRFSWAVSCHKRRRDGQLIMCTRGSIAPHTTTHDAISTIMATRPGSNRVRSPGHGNKSTLRFCLWNHHLCKSSTSVQHVEACATDLTDSQPWFR